MVKFSEDLCQCLIEFYSNGTPLKYCADAVGVRRETVYLWMNKGKKAKSGKYHEFYLEMLADKKLSGEDRFIYCINSLNVKSKQGHWRDAEDFRTENINFMQKQSEKVDMDLRADLYIALALADCAAKHYTQGFKLLMGFGYKPKGKNDLKLLDILITGIYICSQTDNQGTVYNAVSNAHSAMRLITEYEHPWLEDYYEQRIKDAAEGII